jgi:hypothetical protein
MTMTPRVRKLALIAHVASSVGFLGAVACFLALGVVGLTSLDTQTVRAAYLAMESITWLVVVPLCFASLLTGIIQSLGTPWGLFRHYWVLAKLLLTLFTAVVLMLQTEAISYVAAAAAEATFSSADLRGLRGSLVMPHAVGGLLVLFVTTTLSVYKPRGMTRYGWRKERERRALSSHAARLRAT